MRLRIGLAVLALVAVAGAAVAVVAAVQLRGERSDVRALQQRVARLGVPKAAPSSPGETLTQRVADLESQESGDYTTLRSEIDDVEPACPRQDVRDYYQRLLGAQAAGSDVGIELNLLDVICPQQVGGLRYDRSDF